MIQCIYCAGVWRRRQEASFVINGQSVCNDPLHMDAAQLQNVVEGTRFLQGARSKAIEGLMQSLRPGSTDTPEQQD